MVFLNLKHFLKNNVTIPEVLEDCVFISNGNNYWSKSFMTNAVIYNFFVIKLGIIMCDE